MKKDFHKEKPHTNFVVFMQLTRLLLQDFLNKGFSIGKIQAITLYHRKQVQDIAAQKDPQGVFCRISSGILISITWLSQKCTLGI